MPSQVKRAVLFIFWAAFCACLVLAIVAPLTSMGAVQQPPGLVWNPSLQKFTYCYTGARCSSDVCDIDGTCAAFQCDDDSHCFPGTRCIAGLCGVATAGATTGEACSYDDLCLADGPDAFCNNISSSTGDMAGDGTCATLSTITGRDNSPWMAQGAIPRNVEVMFSNVSTNTSFPAGTYLSGTFSTILNPIRDPGEALGFLFVKRSASGENKFKKTKRFQLFRNGIGGATADAFNAFPEGTLFALKQVDVSAATELQLNSKGGECTVTSLSCGPTSLEFQSSTKATVVYRSATAAYVLESNDRYLTVGPGAILALDAPSVGQYVTTIAVNTPAAI